MGNRLWAKGEPLDVLVHRFTVDEDPTLDLQLLAHDCVGSAAHARMCAEVGLLPADGAAKLVGALHDLYRKAQAGELKIDPALEDGHTAIEAWLTAALGELGASIHIGRSRNDQVATAMRLWMRETVVEIALATAKLAAELLKFAQRHERDPMPGYTHMRRAMPSSFGQWAAAIAEGLSEELEALAGLHRRLDRCPLGGAAGFGVPLPLDRRRTAELLGFSRVHVSPIDVQNARGRHEAAFAHALASIGMVLERACNDLLLFSTEEFGLMRLPTAATTGSSIMPQKRNPDVLELSRGRCRELKGLAAWIDHQAGGLSSSYHRDVQLFKKPTLLIGSRLHELLQILTHVVPMLEPDVERGRQMCTDELYAAQAAYERVESDGISFRAAYRQTAEALAAGIFEKPSAEGATHLGHTGQVGWMEIAAELEVHAADFRDRRARLDAMAHEIWNMEPKV